MTSSRSHVLFVDDDSNIIASVRRTFRSKLGVWHLHFATSGQEAIDVARSAPLDLIVTDMRMPGMDGATLLTRVRELHPGAVRIVLSGQSDRAYSVAAAKHAHRFLSKPCPAQDLEEHVGSTLRARSHLNTTGAADLIGLGEVFVEREVLDEFNSAIAAGPFNPEKVYGLIQEHSGIALKLLQLVSSSFFIQVRPTTTIKEAVSSLGPEVLRSLLRSGLFQPVPDDRRRALLECRQLASRRALFVKHIANEFRFSSTERDMLSSAARLITVNQYLRIQQGDAASQENDTWRHIATNAAESAALLELWGVPHSLTQAVARLSNTDSERQVSLQDSVLSLAVGLAQGLLATQEASDYPSSVLETVLNLRSMESWVSSAASWSSEEPY